jgi:hypothetical protein
MPMYSFFQIARAACVNTPIVAIEDINVEKLRASALGRLVFIGWHVEVFMGDLRKLVYPPSHYVLWRVE